LLDAGVDPVLADEAVFALARLRPGTEDRAVILRRARSAPSPASRGLAWIALGLAAAGSPPDEAAATGDLLLAALDAELARPDEGLAPWVALALGGGPPSDERVERRLLAALRRARSPDASGALAVAIGMRGPGVEGEVALVRALAASAGDAQRTRDLVDALGAGRCRSAAGALETLLRTTGDPDLPRRAVRALRRLDVPAWPALAERLPAEADPALRLALLDAAASCEDERALEPLARGLDGSDERFVRGPEERRRATRALASLASMNAWWTWRAWLASGPGSGRLELPSLEAWDPPGGSGGP